MPFGENPELPERKPSQTPPQPGVYGYVFKVTEKYLKPTPCRVDPGDVIIRHSGIYVIEACAPEDTVCIGVSVSWHLQCSRDAVGRILGQGFES